MISTILGKVHAKIEKKLLTSFWENCLKAADAADDDADDDDGRVGIWKAPLPDGTAELKIQFC